ncbi:bifunctional helix-turn-helix transcriptional regulator/GNAT family N-acetyltransferase [Edaphobacter albus]|uniref:bifunctional helix-turn-helix transcriptional regulator/GNAT family N-acetyltransferase n=1 Tax=Edaphobacter sp. 4G125 TaxID=2763071 RepID=UPI002105C1AE|nr:helix-turn-helix domain-containing GNAT family N-acetyltransferase [Edaphobacter sp. 4G125]
MNRPSISESDIASVRRFSRFYTRLLGTLNEDLLQSKLSLAEARVLYEIANRNQPTASEIAAELCLDLGYLSRILRSFSSAKWIRRHSSKSDRRQNLLSLTAAGQTKFETLNQRSKQQVQALLQPLSAEQCDQLTRSMATIQSLLEPRSDSSSITAQPVILRQHRPGDMGWVVERHGLRYSQEYGWDARFEALVARITADFIDQLDPEREHCWIAERNGERLGCVFLVKDKDSDPATTARLRLLLVEPSARGLGLGRTLVQQCTAFAHSAGYKRIVLWTNSVLTSARRIYEGEGYRLLQEKPHQSFGKNLISQDWELLL